MSLEMCATKGRVFIFFHSILLKIFCSDMWSTMFIRFLQFIRPQAASSGIPELMAFLNGTVVRHIFNVKTLIIKFLSCVCAVASGLPVGPEGPMIHMG
jgi:H+/Cl- antiporter ClcA